MWKLYFYSEYTFGFLNSSLNVTLSEGNTNTLINVCVGVTSVEEAENETILDIQAIDGTAKKGKIHFSSMEIIYNVF